MAINWVEKNVYHSIGVNETKERIECTQQNIHRLLFFLVIVDSFAKWSNKFSIKRIAYLCHTTLFYFFLNRPINAHRSLLNLIIGLLFLVRRQSERFALLYLYRFLCVRSWGCATVCRHRRCHRILNRLFSYSSFVHKGLLCWLVCCTLSWDAAAVPTRWWCHLYINVYIMHKFPVRFLADSFTCRFSPDPHRVHKISKAVNFGMLANRKKNGKLF